ncbi:Sugar lactone lactonase YvrE [Amycolatopsis arida]|uniref:Sugar lactone lactonase YvrE n=1 Tax=Amycolatopsis arida TaxID=587909 RepID=A0A1I5QEZ1_9PSEU|nr:superoxide dismutase [Amycolatopsis arida]TDX98811.1 sugar lactone lactonase YvrE [Amycolatopsis arida]SFP44697.1 Sugar lactone lactonase YvrE [Amycolatopsis arida]
MLSRRGLLLGAGATAGAALLAPAATAMASPGRALPDTIPLPDGFRPEGIAIGPGPYAFFGSLDTGAIYRANLLTGRGTVISPGPGTPSVGMKTDHLGRVFVAGGAAGDARVVDGRTGEILSSHRFAAESEFVNDVVLTPGTAWFTSSFQPVLHGLWLDRRGLPREAVRRPLTGDIEYQEGYNANGISRAPDGRGLITVQYNTGLLFRVDPATGVTSTIDLDGDLLPNGDGLLLCGRTLYVVQNRLNVLAVVRLDRSATSGRVVERITDPRFDVPTTVAAFADRLYLVNARFSTPPEPTTPYTAVAIPRP